jgi:mannose-6-phosphate isomerase-like protein (cupin superfamily)
MADVRLATFEEMESIHEGLARRARATLGVTSFGMQVLTLPPNWDGYPDHAHDAHGADPNQEEVYIPLEGSGTLVAGDEQFELEPGKMARVAPQQMRRIVPGAAGIRLVVLGGKPGSFEAPPWTELGGPVPGSDGAH